MKSDSTLDQKLTPAGEVDSGGCAPMPGSVSSDQERNLAYATEHYSEAANYFDESPPYGYICANCGDTTDDAGRFRDAEPWEMELADAAGEIYSCSTCGSSMCLPPQNVLSVPPAEEKIPTKKSNV